MKTRVERLLTFENRVPLMRQGAPSQCHYLFSLMNSFNKIKTAILTMQTILLRTLSFLRLFYPGSGRNVVTYLHGCDLLVLVSSVQLRFPLCVHVCMYLNHPVQADSRLTGVYYVIITALKISRVCMFYVLRNRCGGNNKNKTLTVCL